MNRSPYNYNPQERLYRGEEAAKAPGVPVFGWAQSGKLTTADINGEVGMQGNFFEADTYTVQINLQPPANPPVGFAPEAEATIRWNVAGNVVTRRISVINGTSICGNAQGVSVSVKDVSSASVGGIEYNISILCSRGMRGSFLAPPVLVPRIFGVAPFANNPVIVVAGGSADFDIPVDAGVNLVNVAVGTPGNGITFPPIPDQGAQVLHRGTGIVGVLKRYDPRQCCWEPIAPGAKVLTVRASGPAGGNAIEFHVEYGIDG